MKTYILMLFLLGGGCACYVYKAYPEWMPREVMGDLQSPSSADAASGVNTPTDHVQWTPPATNTTYPSDWTLTDGTQYHKVRVVSVDADAVSIIHEDGAALVDVTTLPVEIQRLVHYDARAYRLAAAQRRSDEVVSDQAFAARQAEKAIAYPNIVSIDIVRSMSQAQQATYFNEHPDEQRNFNAHRFDVIEHRDAEIDHRIDVADHQEAVIDHRYDVNHPSVDTAHRDAVADHREAVVVHRETTHFNSPPPSAPVHAPAGRR